MLGLLGVHIALIRLQGISELHFEGEDPRQPKHFDFFPDHVLSELGIGLFLLLLLSVLATVWPAFSGPRADPLVTPEVIKPEWFFYATFRWLKLFSGTTAVLSMGLIVFLMFIWPWIDGAIRKRFTGSEISVTVGIVAALGIITLTVWEALVAH